MVQALPDHDRALAEAVAQCPVVTGFALTDAPNGVRPLLKASVASAGDDPRPYVAELHGAVATLSPIEAAAMGNGHVNLLAERDGIVRRIPLFLRVGETLYPSLVAESLRVVQWASTYVVKSSGGSGESGFGEHTGLSSIKVGSAVVPTDQSRPRIPRCR